MINVTQLKGHWNEVKGRLQKKWGQLSNDDVAVFEGDLEGLMETIQRRTGVGRKKVEDYLSELSSEFSNGSIMEEASETVSKYAQDVAQGAQEVYENAVDQVREGYELAERKIQRHPTESVLMAFGGGLVAGVIVGLLVRSR